MMRLWLSTYAERPRIGSSAMVSAVIHGAIIAATVVGTLGAPQRLEEKIEEARVQFLPPPDRVLASSGASETLHFFALPAHAGDGLGRAVAARVKPGDGQVAPRVDDGSRPVIVPVRSAAIPGDSVVSALDVDSTVMRYPESAAPGYPPNLLAKDVEGEVVTTYVVDTTGYADTTSLVVVSATDTEFARSVREALPYMRFRPALLRNRKVRQLVSQTFLFRITRPARDTTAIKKSGNE